MSEQAVNLARAKGLTRRLAENAMSLRYEALPENVRGYARHCLLDWIGVTLAGVDDPLVGMVRDEAMEQGGNAQATLLADGRKTSMLQAALVNGTMGHALDFDDVQEAMPGHPSVPVMPVLLALAEVHGASGRDIITAIAAGIETECRVGMGMTEGHYTAGWHATGTVGTFGAAAAAARFFGFDADRCANTFGIAGTQAAGLKSMFGTMCKPLHAGKAAQNGLYAALLTRRGFVARPDVLECEQGFSDTQSPAFDAAAAADGLGRVFHTPGVLFKYHAACYGTHATIEAAKKLRADHGFKPEEIERVEIRLGMRYLKMCNIQHPTTGLEGKFSLRFTSAMALSGQSTAKLDNYSAEKTAEPVIQSLRDRIFVVGDAAMPKSQADVIVSLKGGLVLREHGDVGVPDADLPRQWGKLVEKFHDLVDPIVGREQAARIVATVDGLDGLDDLRKLVALCASRR
ncbi:MAG: MmgE/PrpD family protein [Alphaproteobacteria bacterium]